MMLSLNMLDYPMSLLSLSSHDFLARHVGPLLHAQKLWWVVVMGGLQDFSVSPRPFEFGFETKGLGLRVWGQGLTIKCFRNNFIICYHATRTFC